VSDRAKLSNGGPGSSKANVMTLKLVPAMILCSFLTPSGGQGTQSGQAKPPSPAKTEQQPPTVTPPSSGTPAFYSIGFCRPRGSRDCDAGCHALGHVPGDVNGLAARITELAASPELRARLGRAARLTAERSFDRGRLARDLVPIYQAVLRD
jgi:hypothetical protein